MQIIIDIPEGLMKVIEDVKDESLINQKIHEVISNGTVIPAGHGRLVDGDEILIWLINKKLIDILTCKEVSDVFIRSTIIDADEGE